MHSLRGIRCIRLTSVFMYLFSIGLYFLHDITTYTSQLPQDMDEGYVNKIKPSFGRALTNKARAQWKFRHFLHRKFKTGNDLQYSICITSSFYCPRVVSNHKQSFIIFRHRRGVWDDLSHTTRSSYVRLRHRHWATSFWLHHLKPPDHAFQ